jgi:hypothetical protein
MPSGLWERRGSKARMIGLKRRRMNWSLATLKGRRSKRSQLDRFLTSTNSPISTSTVTKRSTTASASFASRRSTDSRLQTSPSFPLLLLRPDPLVSFSNRRSKSPLPFLHFRLAVQPSNLLFLSSLRHQQTPPLPSSLLTPPSRHPTCRLWTLQSLSSFRRFLLPSLSSTRPLLTTAALSKRRTRRTWS